ncbi:chorismate-binding protein [Flavobacterium wongokense]|uniref:chorismate-binding protein n=1 Tax=Flavobacterium wongokense TaxID=2910674 RepID=UPI001F23BB5E|nr:chorismate-binding protein [Flavobacterium sp. WG47]MCF6132896.1 chorismate-binding protein [Flavobacterium sp. WG47]
MTDLFLKVKIQQGQNLPFVLFCKPDSNKVVGVFQRNDHLYFLESFEEKGFAFAPFDAEEVPYIPLEHSDVYVEMVHSKNYYFESKPIAPNNIIGKDFFEELVAKGVDAINDKEFLKVVLSRKEEVALTDFDIQATMRRMIYQYPNAFKYCFSHPKIGTWIGATPEQFLKTNANSIKTVALAGTQLETASKNVVWQDKEKTEQQLVTDFIVDSLEDLVKEITLSSPYSVKAGNLWHIKTDISATLKSKKFLKKVITALHPTSAVCGLPKQEAKQFIQKNEGYNREYYSGYLGELNIDLVTFKTLQTDLFVNLRCMKVLGNRAQLFIGCGITKDSNPEDEYIETVNKSMTMKKIIS